MTSEKESIIECHRPIAGAYLSNTFHYTGAVSYEYAVICSIVMLL